MSDEIDHKIGDGVPFGHPSTHSSDFVRSVAQDEGLRYTGTPAPPSEPHPEPTRSVVSKDIEETAYGDDTENIIDPASGEVTTFEATLTARYERLSLLTLDLAEEAGESARHFSTIEPKRVDRGIASMTKAIWAHRVIEKLRTGERISTEDLVGFLPNVPPSPVKGPSTHSPDCVRGVAQGEGDVGCKEYPLQPIGDLWPSFTSPSQRSSTRAQNEALGSDAKGEMSLDRAMNAETQAPHLELTRSVVSKGIGQAVGDENTEAKKEKNEIEKRTDTPQTRKIDRQNKIIHPTVEMCGLIVTAQGEYTAINATDTDKAVWPAMDDSLQEQQSVCTDAVRVPP